MQIQQPGILLTASYTKLYWQTWISPGGAFLDDFLCGVTELWTCGGLRLRGALRARALARQSSLTDLRVACEPAASRDSGTDASQASAACSAAGSVAGPHGACSRPTPTSGGWIIPCCNTVGKAIFFKLSVCRLFLPLSRPVCVCAQQCTPGCEWVGVGCSRAVV